MGVCNRTVMNFKDQKKLMEEASKYKYYCKCGHTVVIYPFEKRERKICSWCGQYVYTDPEEQKRYDFKLKMKAILQGGLNGKY